MRAEPRPQERPKAFHGIDMDLAKTVAVIVARVFTSAMENGLVSVALRVQKGIDVVLVCVDEAATGNSGLNDWLDGCLLHISQHIENHFATALYQAEDRRLLFFQRAPTGRSPEPPPSISAFFLTAAGFPLCPPTM